MKWFFTSGVGNTKCWFVSSAVLFSLYLVKSAFSYFYFQLVHFLPIQGKLVHWYCVHSVWFQITFPNINHNLCQSCQDFYFFFKLSLLKEPWVKKHIFSWACGGNQVFSGQIMVRSQLTRNWQQINQNMVTFDFKSSFLRDSKKTGQEIITLIDVFMFFIFLRLPHIRKWNLIEMSVITF